MKGGEQPERGPGPQTEARGGDAPAKAQSDPDATAPPAEPGSRPADPESNRAWLTKLDRKVGTRTYAGAAALVLALATAIVAVVLAVDARENSAGKGEVSRLEQQVASLTESAEATADAEEDIDALSARLDSVEDELGALSSSSDRVEKQLEVIEDDIEDLRRQISDLGSQGSGGSGGSGSGGPG